MIAIETSGLSKTFDNGVEAVKSLDLSVERGVDISTNDKYHRTSKKGALMTILTSYKRIISNKSFTYLFWAVLTFLLFSCSTTNSPLVRENDNSGRHSTIMSIGYTFIESVTENGNIPDYNFTNWDYGPTLGVSIYPLQLKQNYRVGFYLDLYRGSRIYEDIYHKSEGIGGHSYMKYGISLQPLSLKY